MSLRNFVFMTALWTFCASVSGATWEETDGKYFEEGDLAAVKRILAAESESYSGALLTEAFHAAVRSGNIDLVKYLEKRGWIRACRKDKECDPILSAVFSQNLKMLEFMLSRGFPPTRMALSVASVQAEPWSIDFEAVKLLCEKGANPAETLVLQREEKGSLVEASRTTVLQDLEARIAQEDSTGIMNSPLRHMRGTAANIQVAAFFRKGKCKTGAMASTELDDYLREVRAFQDGRLDEVKESQPERNAARYDPRVETYLLYEAIASKNIDLLRYLRDSGWLEHCRRRSYCRPIDAAAEAGVSPETLELLLSEGFEPDTYNASQGTPLLYAAINGRVDAVKFLCRHGADFRKRIRWDIDDDRSIIHTLRLVFDMAWCASATSSKNNSMAEDRCMGVNGISDPLECMPGSTCMLIPFPPKGPVEATQKLMALNEVFQYFKNGNCMPTGGGFCVQNKAKFGTLIGDKVSLRSDPDQASGKVDVLPFGTVVHVIDNTQNCTVLAGKTGRWIKVKVKRFPWDSEREKAENEGWVFDTYVDYLSKTEEVFEERR